MLCDVAPIFFLFRKSVSVLRLIEPRLHPICVLLRVHQICSRCLSYERFLCIHGRTFHFPCSLSENLLVHLDIEKLLLILKLAITNLYLLQKHKIHIILQKVYVENFEKIYDRESKVQVLGPKEATGKLNRLLVSVNVLLILRCGAFCITGVMYVRTFGPCSLFLFFSPFFSLCHAFSYARHDPPITSPINRCHSYFSIISSFKTVKN